MLRSNNAYGILLINLATVAFVFNDAVTKLAFATIPFSQVIGLRSAVALSLLGVIAWRLGAFRIKILSKEWGLLALRGTVELLTTSTYLYALKNMPIADVTAIYLALPLVLALAAVLFLGERFGWRRSLAIAVGFLGVLVMLRPGVGGFSYYMILPLLAVFFTAVRDITVRGLRPEVPGALVAFAGALPLTLGFSLIGPVVEPWIVPTWFDASLIGSCACLVVVGYIAMVSATRHGDISILAPFRYMALVWAVLCGMVIFGEYPDIWMAAGAVLVVGSGLFMVFREARLKATAV